MRMRGPEARSNQGRWAALARLLVRGSLALAVFGAPDPAAAFDLSRAERRVLDNQLTVLVLEEPALPVVSVQMLYRVGARNEPPGLTGIAHFLEHMAFRATEHFPDTGVVSEIYAVGGEWHGYTWLDQTTYFETVPAEHLDLGLRIEADRMARLLIPAGEVEAERSAVLSEMHGYQNDPASVLKDSVLAVSFLQHPYRNNTIGWESDVRSIGRDDLVEFYRRHYRPSNAVLAIVGRLSTPQVLARVEELFGDLPPLAPSRPPATVEPLQNGVRRVEVPGSPGRQFFEIAYRAPPVNHPDYPGFLLLQQVLAGGAGINFVQNEFGDPVRPGTRLEGVSADLVSWFPPQAMPYVLTFAGSIDAGASADELEARLELAIAGLRAQAPPQAELDAARAALLDELIYDLETTEDAAHQLAYYEGIGGLDVLLELPGRLHAVVPGDIRRLASKYLGPERRTIGWARTGAVAPTGPVAVEDEVPTARPSEPSEPSEQTEQFLAAPGASAKPTGRHAAAEGRLDLPGDPVLNRLASGLPVLFRRMPLSSAAHLRLILAGASIDIPEAGLGLDAVSGRPLWRSTSVEARFRPGDLEAVLRGARRVADLAKAVAAPGASEIDDPAGRLHATLQELSGVSASLEPPRPIALAIAGDLSETEVRALAGRNLGDLVPGTLSRADSLAGPRQVTVELAAKAAQAQLGYVVAAPGARDLEWFAWRVLLYVLSHGYEGRLGKEAISRRGLVYWIDANYLTDSVDGRITLEIGVDPENLEPMRALLAETLRGLIASPPTEAEIREAKTHLLGRRASAAQSNAEVTAALATEYVGRGRLLSDAEFAAALEGVSRADVLRALPEFVAGVTVVVEVGR